MVRGRGKAKILGLGLDNNDDQVRITRSKNFHLVGGSKETHGSMQEKCVKFDEKLESRGKELDELEKNEFLDMAQECGMNILLPRPTPRKN